MTIYQIEAFLAVAKIYSFSKAADYLNITQSTVSHRIKSLEDELGYQLFTRQKGQREAELTSAGEKMIPLAQEFAKLWEDFFHIDEEKTNSILSIGAPNSILLFLIKDLLTKIFNEEKYVSLSVSANHSAQVLDLLESRTIDVGFVTVPNWNKNIILKPVIEEPFKLVCFDPDYKLNDFVHPEELDPRKEIFHPWGPAHEQWHNYWWGQNKFKIQVDDQPLVSEFFNLGNLWTVVPNSLATKLINNQGYRALDFTNPPQKRIAYYAKHKYPKQSSVANIEVFEQYLNVFLSNTPNAQFNP